MLVSGAHTTSHCGRRYVTSLLDQEQQMYHSNLASACAILGIPETDHGFEIYCMEEKVHETIVLAEPDDALGGSPQERLRTLALDESRWHHHFKHNKKLLSLEMERFLERQRIVEFVIDVCTVYKIRQQLIRRFKVGVVGPMKSGKSKFLQNLGCKSGADASIHTNDVTAYRFDDGSGASDKLLLLDFPGYDDADDRVAQAFSKHCNILDA